MKHVYFQILLFIIVLFCVASCTSNAKSKKENDNPEHSYSSSKLSEDENTEESNQNSLNCTFNDGTYSATVDYSNSETGYSSTYTLDVEVENCQVVQIDFPNGGYLDEDHIAAADLDEDGNATVEGEDEKTYQVKISN